MTEEPRFLFVDRILACEQGRRIRAGHRVPDSSDPHAGPYQVLEALAQAAGWLIAASTGFAKRGLPIAIGSIRLTGPVPIGGALLLEADIDAWRDESALVRAKASANGQAICEIERGLCAFVPNGRLEDPEQTMAMFSLLLGRGRQAPEAAGFDCRWPTPDQPDWAPHPSGGARVRGSWSVGAAEPCFRDHFPRLPIVPGALQVQAMVELARRLVDADGTRPPVLEGMKELKFRGFVRPGDRLLLVAEALSLTAEQGITAAEGLVGGKRVTSVKEIHWSLHSPAVRHGGSAHPM